MTHTEESLMALAYSYAATAFPSSRKQIEGHDKAREDLRIAIREVLAERDSCAGQIAEAVDQRDRQARRAERAEAERDYWKADAAELERHKTYYKERAEKAEAECERMKGLLRRYRTEVPLGHQPYMIAHEVDAALKDQP